MISVRMMQNPVHKVINVIAMRNRLMTAAWPVDMVAAL